MIIFATVQLTVGFILLVALIFNNINYKNRMRKIDERFDKMREDYIKDTKQNNEAK